LSNGKLRKEGKDAGNEGAGGEGKLRELEELRGKAVKLRSKRP
jgi:hypothetical protein